MAAVARRHEGAEEEREEEDWQFRLGVFALELPHPGAAGARELRVYTEAQAAARAELQQEREAAGSGGEVRAAADAAAAEAERWLGSWSGNFVSEASELLARVFRGAGGVPGAMANGHIASDCSCMRPPGTSRPRNPGTRLRPRAARPPGALCRAIGRLARQAGGRAGQRLWSLWADRRGARRGLSHADRPRALHGALSRGR